MQGTSAPLSLQWTPDESELIEQFGPVMLWPLAVHVLLPDEPLDPLVVVILVLLLALPGVPGVLLPVLPAAGQATSAPLILQWTPDESWVIEQLWPAGGTIVMPLDLQTADEPVAGRVIVGMVYLLALLALLVRIATAPTTPMANMKSTATT